MAQFLKAGLLRGPILAITAPKRGKALHSPGAVQGFHAPEMGFSARIRIVAGDAVPATSAERQ